MHTNMITCTRVQCGPPLTSDSIGTLALTISPIHPIEACSLKQQNYHVLKYNAYY